MRHAAVVGLSIALVAGCPPAKRTLPSTVTTTVTAPPPPPPLPPPSDDIPKLRLPRTFVPTGYHAQLAIDPARDGFDGRIQIAGTIATTTSVIWLHGKKLAIASAVASPGSDPYAARRAADVQLVVTPRGEDLLELRAATPLAPGAWTLTIAYAAPYDLVNTAGAFKQTVGKDAYVYSQLEAIYARRVFPCFDEPDVKVPWQLTLDVPKGMTAVSNTPIVKAEETEGPDATHHRVEFEVTKPLPSYLVAFGVGPFDVVDAGTSKHGTPMHVYALHGRAADAAIAARTAGRLLDLDEEWFGQTYPYPKLDFLTIPLTVGFSAMENAGLITMTEEVILLDPKASHSRQHTWAVVAAHEIAHQWFGDLVTMAWWDDIWLNEGFANWLEHKITARFDPTWHDELTAVGTHRIALELDSLTTARKVREPIATTDDILTAFDYITYTKGQAVLDMFETFVGPEKFRAGVQAYLQGRQFGTATSTDFVSAISKVAGRDLAPAFSTFLDQAGEPEIIATVECGKNKASTIALAQHRYVPPGAPVPAAQKPWIVPVCVAYDDHGKRAEACTMLDDTTGAIALPAAFAGCPRWVMTNVGGHAYYRSSYSAAQLAALRDEAWEQLAWPERMSVGFEARARAAIGTLPIALAISFVPKLLAGNDRFTIDDAAELANGLHELVPDELRGRFEQWTRATYGPAMDKVGLVPRSDESIDAESTRRTLVEIVGGLGHEPKLVEQAVALADHWRDLPSAIRGEVLALAVDAHAAQFDRALHEIYTEPDRAKRSELIHAVGGVRDRERQAQALALVLDAKLDIRETGAVLRSSATEANRHVAQQFFKEHQAAIMKRLPEDGTAGPAGEIAGLFTESCDAVRRDETASYVTTTFAALPGGARVVQQAIEGMDQCIAARKIVLPELRGWLSGVKIPGPSKAPSPVKAPAVKAPPARPARAAHRAGH